MAMDTDNMSTKDALNAVDSLINFLENQSTANMETVVQRYEGQQAIKQLKKKGIKAKALPTPSAKLLNKSIPASRVLRLPLSQLTKAPTKVAKKPLTFSTKVK